METYFAVLGYQEYSELNTLLILFMFAEEITTDEIIASAAHVMEATIEFLHEKYGDVEAYLRSAGMRQEEIEDIKNKLKDHRGEINA